MHTRSVFSPTFVRFFRSTLYFILFLAIFTAFNSSAVLFATPDYYGITRLLPCLSNLRVLNDALEMYNLDNPDHPIVEIGSGTLQFLVDSKHLKMIPTCYEENSAVYSYDSEKHEFSCSFHGGFAEFNERVKSLKEMVCSVFFCSTLVHWHWAKKHDFPQLAKSDKWLIFGFVGLLVSLSLAASMHFISGILDFSLVAIWQLVNLYLNLQALSFLECQFGSKKIGKSSETNVSKAE